jgi:hypothetical protein
MSIIRGKVLQPTANTFTQVAIDTNLTSDGKSAWKITGLHAFFSGLYSQPAADIREDLILSTRITTVTTMDEPEEIARCSISIGNTGGVAVSYPLVPHQSAIILGERLTVQPNLYVGLSTVGDTAAADCFFILEYEVIKLSDIDVLRLLVAGG